MQPSGYAIAAAAPAASLDATFAALADPTRRAILARLSQGEKTVTELAEPFALSQPAISKHLKVLERAHLISRDRDAQRRPSRLEAAPLAAASEWLERYREFWDASFTRLDDLLASLQKPEGAAVASRQSSARKSGSTGGRNTLAASGSERQKAREPHPRMNARALPKRDLTSRRKRH